MSSVMQSGRPLKIYLIAGEASGDLLGAHLMQALKEILGPSVVFHGVGGERMTAEGLKSLFPYYELSMMGFVEILPYLFNLSARIALTVDDIMAKEPDVVVTIDSPGFNFRVVERMRKQRMKKCLFVHYVAPSVWAYKPERAKRTAELFDHLLTLLPFEAPLFEKEGLKCTWVGHAAVAETQVGDGAAFRAKFEIPPDAPIFCLLPGSRKSEVERHMPVFGRAVTMLAGLYPQIAITVPVPRNIMPFVSPFFETCPFRAVVTSNEQEKKDAIAASTLAIVKSGTVALEVAKASVPMVVAYRVHPVSAWYVRRKALIHSVNLINILENKDIIPELLQEDCTPDAIANACLQLLQNQEQQDYQKNMQKSALAKLTPADGEAPSRKAAQTILRLLS